MTLEPQLTDLPRLVEHVVSLVSTDAGNRGIDIAVDRDEDLPPLMVDPNQVTQALLNLILNALHAVQREGRIGIRILARNDGDGVCVQVEDDGPGIPPERVEKIFEPFYTTRDQGAGLGLAMVRKIAENHEGKVVVVSPPPGKQRGTRFSLVLRSMAGAAAEKDRSTPSDRRTGENSKGERA